MNLHILTVYSLIVTAIVFCPGPMTLFSMSTSMKVGSKETIPALLGGSTAYITQLIIVSLGLGLLLQHSIIAFDAIKWFGAAYLIYLGIKQWLASDIQVENTVQTKPMHSVRKLYLRGFLVGATNPKSIIVFTALFPQFISPQIPQMPQLLTLSILFLLLQFTSAMSYAFFGNQVFKWLQKKKKEKLQRKITGAILITAGVVLAGIKK